MEIILDLAGKTPFQLLHSNQSMIYPRLSQTMLVDLTFIAEVAGNYILNSTTYTGTGCMLMAMNESGNIRFTKWYSGSCHLISGYDSNGVLVAQGYSNGSNIITGYDYNGSVDFETTILKKTGYACHSTNYQMTASMLSAVSHPVDDAVYLQFSISLTQPNCNNPYGPFAYYGTGSYSQGDLGLVKIKPSNSQVQWFKKLAKQSSDVEMTPYGQSSLGMISRLADNQLLGTTISTATYSTDGSNGLFVNSLISSSG